MNTPFQILRNRAERAQQLSEEWLQEQAQTLNITPSRFLADTKRLVNRPMLGRMYMFQYDPKLKESTINNLESNSGQYKSLFIFSIHS